MKVTTITPHMKLGKLSSYPLIYQASIAQD